MPRFHKTMNVNSTPDEAWAILGDLAGVDKWVPGITGVEIEGNRKRICHFTDGRIQHEEIVGYSNENRSYGYTIEGIPGMKNNHGTFAVIGQDQGCAVIWDSAFEVIDPAQEGRITHTWEEAMNRIIGSLRKLIEESR